MSLFQCILAASFFFGGLLGMWWSFRQAGLTRIRLGNNLEAKKKIEVYCIGVILSFFGLLLGLILPVMVWIGW